jgi:hypothetical protein
MAYADYAYYSGTWMGDMPEADFNKWSARAGIEIDRLTQGRAADAPTSMGDALAQCCCELAESMQQQDSAAQATQGGAVAGESVDGYSVTYRGSIEGSSLQDAADAARLNICRKYLCRPVNLLYSGVQP